MKCLCFSDSHGNIRYLKSALERHRDAEVVFFLGDGLSDLERVMPVIGDKAVLSVKGNCDIFGALSGKEVEKTSAITLEGVRVVFTHGDLYGAKYGFDGLSRLGEERGADVVLYGHTHYALEKYISLEERGLYLLNPGTVGGVYQKPTYGVLNLENGRASFVIMDFEDL